MKLTPSATARSTSAKISSSRRSSAAPPPSTLYSPRTMIERKTPASLGSLSMRTIFASASLSITGNGSTSLRACSGRSSSRFGSGPMAPPIAVTSSSRIASSGGFVTCANICVK